MDPVAEIKSRISIEDLVGQYVALKKVGRQFKALCPFHKERTPSFYVSPERELAYCFGCRKGGDHFSFIQEIEGLDFRGALEFLAEKAGVALPKISPSARLGGSASGGPAPPHSIKDRLYALHEAAAIFFEERLWDAPKNSLVRQYVGQRGLLEATVRSARLGFAPDTPAALFSHLLAQGFTRAEIIESGLAMARDTSQSECADRFRGRLIFPIENTAGRICAFAGRALASEQEPKYLNSPETSIYHKSAVLYGLARARAAIRREGAVFVVEGYLDALTCRENGIENVVACSGTALTSEHLTLVKRFAKEAIFALDRDAAGRAAAIRAIELAFEGEIALKVAVWEGEAKDPDECLRTSPEAFHAAIKNALPATEYLVREMKTQANSATIEGRKSMFAFIRPFLLKIKSPLELDLWLKRIADELATSRQSLSDELRRHASRWLSPRPSKTASSDPEALVKTLSLAEYLVGIFLAYPNVASDLYGFLKPEDFEEIELQNIYRTVSTQYNQTPGAQKLSETEARRANIMSLEASVRLGEMPLPAVSEEAKNALKNLTKQQFDRKKRALVAEIKSASEQAKSELLTRLQALLTEEEALHGKKV